MGLLASQKYDFVLESFLEYLNYYDLLFGNDEEQDKCFIKDFLYLCDNGWWEI